MHTRSTGGNMTETDRDSCSRELHEMRLLYEISTMLGETPDLKSGLAPALEKISKHLDILRGTITILNRTNREIAIEEAYGLDTAEVARGRYQLGEGITGKVIASGEAVGIPRISEEPRFLDKTGARKNLDKSDISFVCVPIKIGSEVIGAISIDKLYNEQVSLEDDIRLLTIVAYTISQAVRIRQVSQEEVESLKEENSRLQQELYTRYKPESVIGNSKIMRLLYREMEQVSGTSATVLLLGESGVGKEKVAHAIHYSSPRAGKPFIKMNCAAIPETLIESELFGHEKGAFTNAITMRKGRFEMADCGTIFLDEIGEMPLAVQTKFLRILQEREFERIGGTETIKVNIRIIAATNRNLPDLIREGKFREDLYYRLNVFPLVVPPLRERKTDIILLADHFVEKFSREHSKSIKNISSPAINLLMAYAWPGNVRELENCIERAVILSSDETIHSYHLPPSLQTGPKAGEGKTGTLTAIMDAVEQEIINEELKRCDWNMSRAAANLGITERMMGLRVVKYELKRKGEQNVNE
jgi:Nif-specific regulatory protein